MAFDHKKSVTFRLAQAAKAQRARAGSYLSKIGLHPGQEAVLKSLFDNDDQTMSQLAGALGVQPPTVTKMVTRLSAQNLVRRTASKSDGRLAHVCLTDEGRELVKNIDRTWKRLEKEAVAKLDDKDRKRLRKLLRIVERSLSNAPTVDAADAEMDDADAD
ncbi:DNA-binding MarR family transcriptional regulator [Rhodobium orientis]|uniref:MarR family transcriptional regulator n=1 Tax=Rhodobium orientis TaxID=34017 RepID=A0A327JIP7_9HYPH|nr:MarR family transcriptional regulator [Rhodobium orientis]MBB4304448.1 DNA-binding MarR family transcriptional regulator [Rhodobium orientis]MBK5949973.1 MarR family transcriptional regulator [Rhodobium orientis]RAI25596.1 MarR family transcriptional regulator [Rhodobium orientis]